MSYVYSRELGFDCQKCHHPHQYHSPSSNSTSTTSSIPEAVVKPSSTNQAAVQPSTSTEASTFDIEFDRCVPVKMTHYYLDHIIFIIF